MTRNQKLNHLIPKADRIQPITEGEGVANVKDIAGVRFLLAAIVNLLADWLEEGADILKIAQGKCRFCPKFSQDNEGFKS